MQDYLDYEGLLEGLDVFSNIEDTKIIVYLATNSTAGNDLKLKNLALEFAGNYSIM
jgi:DNA polymerase-1